MKKPDENQDEWPPEVVAKVAHDQSARNAVMLEHPQLFAHVAEAMFREDPVGINFETNTDEYDPEAGTVIPRLKDCSSPEDVTTVIYEEFSKWFGADSIGSKADLVKLGEEIWQLWKTDQSE